MPNVTTVIVTDFEETVIQVTPFQDVIIEVPDTEAEGFDYILDLVLS